MLAAIRRVELPGQGFGIWLAPDADAPAASWPEYLCSVADRDEERLVGWRGNLARHQRASEAFRLGCTMLEAGSEAFPTARGLVHADLLLNHLIGPDGSITAVFDWGNALAGDPLYDIAWIVYCIPWFPAIDRRHVLDLARLRFPDDDLDRLLPLYELHIALGELQYAAFREDVAGMDGAAGRLERRSRAASVGSRRSVDPATSRRSGVVGVEVEVPGVVAAAPADLGAEFVESCELA